MIDVKKPLLWWTIVSIGGVTYMVLFCYEKLANFCYLCGRLNHLEMHCTLAQPDGLRYFGPLLRANNKNPIYLDEIMRDLNQTNSSRTPPGLQSASPITPTSKELMSPDPKNAKYLQYKKLVRDTTPIHMQGLDIKSNNTPLEGSTNEVTAPKKKKPAWTLRTLKLETVRTHFQREFPR